MIRLLRRSPHTVRRRQKEYPRRRSPKSGSLSPAARRHTQIAQRLPLPREHPVTTTKNTAGDRTRSWPSPSIGQGLQTCAVLGLQPIPDSALLSVPAISRWRRGRRCNGQKFPTMITRPVYAVTVATVMSYNRQSIVPTPQQWGMFWIEDTPGDRFVIKGTCHHCNHEMEVGPISKRTSAGAAWSDRELTCICGCNASHPRQQSDPDKPGCGLTWTVVVPLP